MTAETQRKFGSRHPAEEETKREVGWHSKRSEKESMVVVKPKEHCICETEENDTQLRKFLTMAFEITLKISKALPQAITGPLVLVCTACCESSTPLS